MFNKWFIVLTLTALVIAISCKNSPTDSKNIAPTASFTISPTTGYTITTFTFDASGSSDNEDETSVLQVRWDWNNDGVWDTDYNTTKTATHQYSSIGTYTINLEVKDSEGLSNTSTNTVSVQQQGNVVTFNDANFETLIREVLNKPSGDITPTDLLTITDLDGEKRDISDISGIEYCTNIQILNLGGNQISDISTLSTLTNLQQYLGLWKNQIIDINALSTLTKLQHINLGENQISDISVLSTLTNLQKLFLHQNQIEDIYTLSSLTNLQKLGLADNKISDISVLSTLTNLQELNIRKNQFNDINVLSALMNLQWLSISDNQISDIGVLSGLTNIQTLYLYDNQIIDIGALSGLTNLQELYSQENQIIDINPLIQNSGIDNGDIVYLTNNPLSDTSINTYIPQLEARGVTVNY